MAHEQLKQTYIDFGTDSTLDLIHAGFKPGGYACIASISSHAGWTQKFHRIPEIHSLCGLLTGAPDTYLSMSSFRTGKRTVLNVSELSCVWVDLDYYKSGIKGDPVRVLESVLEAVPWIPVPTITVNSGRGLYFFWTLAEPIGQDQLPRWSTIIEAYVDALRPFGADPAATDAARVLRVIGTSNSKSNSDVYALQTGPVYRLSDLMKTVHEKPVLVVSNPEIKRPPRKKQDQKINDSIKGKAWAFKVCDDLERLAMLRGGRFGDCRSRALFVYGVQAGWWTLSSDETVRKTQDFIDEFFLEPEKYKAADRLTTVVHKIDNKDQLCIWKGVQVPNRYRIGKKRIIQDLEITENEQRALKYLISKKIKDERLTQSRRDKGINERSEYLEPVNQRRTQAADLFAEGASVAEVMDQLGVSRSTAYRDKEHATDICGKKIYRTDLTQSKQRPFKNCGYSRDEQVKEMMSQGMKQADVARALGVTRGYISQIIKRGKEHGTSTEAEGESATRLRSA